MIAVLVLNWNGKRHLQECFQSLHRQTRRDFVTYLVDNGSSDDSVSFVKNNFPWVKIIEFKENLGFVRAYNLAAGMVEEESLFFLNNDVYVKEDCLEKLEEKKDRGEILGCRLFFYENRKIINHAGMKILPTGGGYEIGHGEEDSDQFCEGRFVGAVCGAAMLVRREVFLELLFDEDYEAYNEDIDLCWRAWLTGRRVLYVPEAVVFHKFGGSYIHASFKTIYLTQKNRLTNILKNFSFSYLLRAMFINLLYDGTRFFLFLTEGRFDIMRAMVGGYAYNLRNIFTIMEKRKKVQKERKIPDSELYERGFIATFGEAKREYERLKRLKDPVTH